MTNKSPEAPLQIAQLRSEQDLREFAKLVNSSFPVSEPSQRLIEPLVDFLRTTHSAAPHVASIAVFDRNAVYLTPIMEVHAIWDSPILHHEHAKEIRGLWNAFAEVCLRSERDFTALLYGDDPRKYPTLEVLASKLSAEVKPPASLRVVACAQFQR